MSKQNRLRPLKTAHLLDAVILLLLTFIALLKRDYVSGKLFFDWVNLSHYIPFYIVYIVTVCFYREYKKKRVLVRYLSASLLWCLAVAVVWSLFIYDSLPKTKSEDIYEHRPSRRPRSSWPGGAPSGWSIRKRSSG